MTIDQQTCQAIQCGVISQAEAGAETLFACSRAGFVGAKPCTDPTCECQRQLAPPVDIPVSNYYPPTPPPAPVTTTPITPWNLTAPMPSITNPIPEGTVMDNPVQCGGMVKWINDNPMLAAAAVIGAAWMLRR